mgnify:CR=1 FL=1
MTTTLKIRRQGNSLGLTLPSAMTDALRLKEGDEVHVTQTTDGLIVRAHDPEFARGVEAVDRVFRRYRNTLRALADA